MFYLLAVTLSSYFFWFCVILVIAGSFGIKKLSEKLKNNSLIIGRETNISYTGLEMAVQIIACFIIAMIVNSWALSSVTGMTDTKIQTGYKEQAHYRASFVERVRHSRSSGSGKHRRTSYYYSNDYRADKWWMTDSFGRNKDIGMYAYEELVAQLGNSRQVRGSQPNQVSGDGREWQSDFETGKSTIIPVLKTSLYVNMLKGSKEIRKYDKKYSYLRKAKEYPAFTKYDMSRRIVSDGPLDVKYTYDISDVLAKISAENGKFTDLNLVMYISDQSKGFKYRLLSDWKMGKRNDVVLIIGSRDGNFIEWVEVVAWSKNNRFSEELSQELLKLNLLDVNGIDKAIRAKIGFYSPMNDKEYEFISRKIDIPASFYYIAGGVNILVFMALGMFFMFTDVLKKRN